MPGLKTERDRISVLNNKIDIIHLDCSTLWNCLQLCFLTNFPFHAQIISRLSGDDKAIRAMMQMGIKWHKLIYVYDDDRQEVTNAACGKRLWVSTGVWGVCLALTSDAKSVHAVGISLGPGHVATGDQLPRDHVNEDKECLRLLTERFADRLIIDPALRSQL